MKPEADFTLFVHFITKTNCVLFVLKMITDFLCIFDHLNNATHFIFVGRRFKNENVSCGYFHRNYFS